MNCPQCGAPMKLDENRDYFYCTYCGSYYIPNSNKEGVSLLGEASSLKCPMCAATLVAAAVNRIRILACPNCHGNLIKQSELEPIIESAPPTDSDIARLNCPPDFTELQRKFACPSCQGIMESYAYAGTGAVIIQSCGTCQLIWLDFGELSKIIWSSQHTEESTPDERELREDDFDTMAPMA